MQTISEGDTVYIKSDFRTDILFTTLRIGMLGDPTSYLTREAMYTADESARQAFTTIFDLYVTNSEDSLLQAAAKHYGVTTEVLQDPEKCTEEQNAVMQIIRTNEFLVQLYEDIHNNYRRAMQILKESKPDQASLQSLQQIRVYLIYFFTTNPQIRPGESGYFDEHPETAKDLVRQYKSFKSFISENYKPDEKIKVTSALEAFARYETPDKAEEIIESLSSKVPESFTIANNKLANTMTKDIIDIGEITLEVSRKGKRHPMTATCILNYEGDAVTLSGRQSYTEYDRNVYNAVCSLYVYGDPSHVMTAAMVYRAMTGLTDTEKPTAGQIEAVTNSLDKMRFIRARIDCTNELKRRGITLNSKQINGGEIDTYLLTARAVKVQAGGQTVRAYRILDTPILYEYAAAVKQVLTLPASVLDVKEITTATVNGKKKQVIGARLPNTETRILIKGYLIRRIEGMKGDNNLNNPVIALYDYERDGETHQGLYSVAGKPNAKDLEAKRIRTDAEKMLCYWTATGYIKSFGIKTQGRKITGYTITI